MSDLVARLRERHSFLCDEAAEEIERLRGELESAESDGEDMRQVRLQLYAEIERLRAGLQLIANDKNRLMNEVARQTAGSILGGKPIGEVTEWPYAQAMCREDLPNAEIVALRVKLYNVERDLEDSEADNKRLREFIEGLPDGDEIVRLRGLLTRIHGIAAEPRPVNMAVRLENIACIASWERDETYAQLTETQRFPHSAETESISRAICREDLPFLAATAQPVLHGAVKFYWIQGPLTNYGTTEKGFNGEVRVVSEADFNIAVRLLQKIMARCADLLDEDQFNELDAMTRATVTVSDSATGVNK